MTETLTQDDFLGGRIKLWQPRDGYRAGVDPVLLAAATPAIPGQSVLELGCGVGAASLCLGARVPGLNLTGIELQPDYAALARRNAAENRVDLEVIEADLRTLPVEVRNTSYDHVLMNPPYFERGRGTSANDQGRDIALVGNTTLNHWIDTAARRLGPKGQLTLIQRIDRLPEILTAVNCKLGSVAIKPVAARKGRPPKLFLLQARKGGRGAFQLCAPLILHKGERHLSDHEDYRPEIRKILRKGAALALSF